MDNEDKLLMTVTNSLLLHHAVRVLLMNIQRGRSVIGINKRSRGKENKKYFYETANIMHIQMQHLGERKSIMFP
jgi:hypothetical protein